MESLAAQPTASIPLASQGWHETKAAYRLLENPALEWREILDSHIACTEERIREQAAPVVLCIQDTAELDACPELAEGWARKPKDEADIKESVRWTEGYERGAEMAERVSAKRLERALVVYLIIAWRILHVVTWGKECPDLPCDAAP